jgi:D-alanine--poly(phosphoribitol) ligase subunit 2
VNALSAPSIELIRRYIEDQFLVEFDDVLTDRSDLFKEGILDSFGYVKFCRFLENTYGIRFSDAEITGNVMVNLRQIEDCVAVKVAG